MTTVTFDLNDVAARFDEILEHIRRGDDVRIHRNGAHTDVFKLFLARRDEREQSLKSSAKIRMAKWWKTPAEGGPPAALSPKSDYVPSGNTRQFNLDMHAHAIETPDEFFYYVTEDMEIDPNYEYYP